MEYAQYIVVRKDLVPIMGVGKCGAMCAHSSVGAILNNGKLYDHPNIQAWIAGRFVKLVVYVKTKQKLLNLHKKLNDLGIRNVLIYDACRTVFEEPEESNGTTLVSLGVLPLNRNEVPKCLQVLRLLD